MRRDRQRLEDILEAIERIEKYASGVVRDLPHLKAKIAAALVSAS